MNSQSLYLKLFAITLLGAGLRFATIDIGLTLDDACSAFVVEADNLGEMVARLRDFEMSPPLYFLLLRLFTTGNMNCATMALPSIICGILTIPATFALALETTAATADQNKASRIALLAALFAAISPLTILYSHEARSYGLAGLLTALTLTAYLRFFRAKVSIKDGLFLCLSGIALIYTHYTGIIFLGLLAAISQIFRHCGKIVYSLIPITLSLFSLLPWLPILLYHRSIGTPWVDPTPLSKFGEVVASNLAATFPLPVVPAYVLTIFLCPLLLAWMLFFKPQSTRKALFALYKNPPLSTLLLLMLFAVCAFGYITPFKFGYSRYMSPIACAFFVFYAYILVLLPQKRDFFCLSQDSGKQKLFKASFFSLLAFLIAFDILDTATLVSEDRSGMRKVAAFIAERSRRETEEGKRTLYITAPDFTGMSLVFYLKHDQNLSMEKLPELSGFACPQSGKRWVKHEEDVDCYEDPNLLAKQTKIVEDFQRQGYKHLILIRDQDKPDSKRMPTKRMIDSFEAILKEKYKASQTKIYRGRATSYEVTEWAL